MLINRAATFRGRIVDHGVSKSPGGFMQWTAELIAMEIWDTDEDKWVDWTDYGDEYGDEIKSYNILFGGNEKPTLSCQQVKAITGWEGTSFAALGAMDLTETKIQFRTEWNTYNDKTNLQVEWIDVYDAIPGRSVKKLNAAELKSLDAEFSKMLKQSGKTKAPVKASTKAGTVTKKGVSPTQNKGPVTKKTAKVTNPIEAPVEEATQTPPGPPAALPTAPSTATKEAENAVSGSCTKNEAWKTILDLKKKDIGDEALANMWLSAINAVAPNAAEQEDVTNEQWWVVRTKVLEQVSAV